MELVRFALDLSRGRLPVHVILGLGVLAGLQTALGHPTEAENSISEAKEDPHRESWAVFYLLVLIADAELALHEGEHRRALAVTDDLLALLRGCGMRSGLPEALYLQAKVLMGVGQRENARSSPGSPCRG